MAAVMRHIMELQSMIFRRSVMAPKVNFRRGIRCRVVMVIVSSPFSKGSWPAPLLLLSDTAIWSRGCCAAAVEETR
jgi:hypothetical protein